MLNTTSKFVLVFFLFCVMNIAQSITSAKGPGFYNATEDRVRIKVTYKEGDKLETELAAGELFLEPREVNLQAMEVYVDDALIRKVSAEYVLLAHKELKKPHLRIWVIDDYKVCVIPSRHFSAIISCEKLRP